MPDNKTEYRQSKALKALISANGENYIEDVELGFPEALVKSLVPMVAMGLFAIPLSMTFFTSGWLNWTSIAIAIPLFFLALNGFAAMLALFINFNTRVLVYADKLVFQRGNTQTTIRWEDVQEVFVQTREGRNQNPYYYEQGKPEHIHIETQDPLLNFTSEQTILKLDNDKLIVFDGTINGYSFISTAIQNQVNRRAYSMAVDSFHSGKTLQFGPLTIHSDGVEVDDVKVTWRLHRCSWIDGGNVIIQDTQYEQIGNTYTTDYFPNLASAMKLMTDISRRYQPVESSDGEDHHPRTVE